MRYSPSYKEKTVFREFLFDDQDVSLMLFDNTQRFELYQMEYKHLIVEGSGQPDEFAADSKYTEGKAMQISVRA